MSDEHGSFIMYTESWSGIQLLSREQRGDLLTALMAFHGADDCEMPKLDQATACVFAIAKRKAHVVDERAARQRELNIERVRRFRARKKAAAAGTSETMEVAHHADGV